jgi:hypothetical protein
MSAHAHETAAPAAEFFDRKHTGNWLLILLAASAGGIIVSLIGAFVNRSQFAYSWLFAFTYFFTLCAGSLFWVLVHHAVDAEWSVVVRRVLENVAALLPVMILFFVPVLLCAPILFKWWTIPHGVDAALDKKHAFLNIPFFLVRSGVYFTLLSGAALLLRGLSIRQDGDGNTAHTVLMRKLAVAGIPCFAISLTFAAFDWLMGLDYHWFSTMWGVYIFAGAAGASMSMLVLIVTALRSKGYLQFVTMEHYHIMGKLMLAFCVFWAYIGFSQYMLIWYANIPEETSYFIRRNIESWNVMSIFLVVFRFFVPFGLLLLQGTKKNPKWLCIVAGWLVFMQMIDIYVVVMPMLHHEGFAPHILDLAALLAIGPLLAFIFLRGLGKNSLFPMRDPRLPESLRLTN